MTWPGQDAAARHCPMGIRQRAGSCAGPRHGAAWPSRASRASEYAHRGPTLPPAAKFQKPGTAARRPPAEAATVTGTGPSAGAGQWPPGNGHTTTENG
jgi:hypothetical protein